MKKTLIIINVTVIFSTQRVFSFITSLWLVGLRQISVLSVFRKMWCNSWCYTIFQKVFNAKYYTFAGLSTLSDCTSIRLLWCNTPRKYYTSIKPNSLKWCNTPLKNFLIFFFARVLHQPITSVLPSLFLRYKSAPNSMKVRSIE